MNNLLWLIQWYNNQCDGDWEHCNAVEIHSIDNPGWRLIVCLGDTELEDTKFDTIEVNRSDKDWIYCSVENRLFKGYCGQNNFPEMLQTFRSWAENKS